MSQSIAFVLNVDLPQELAGLSHEEMNAAAGDALFRQLLASHESQAAWWEQMVRDENGMEATMANYHRQWATALKTATWTAATLATSTEEAPDVVED